MLALPSTITWHTCCVQHPDNRLYAPLNAFGEVGSFQVMMVGD